MSDDMKGFLKVWLAGLVCIAIFFGVLALLKLVLPWLT